MRRRTSLPARAGAASRPALSSVPGNAPMNRNTIQNRRIVNFRHAVYSRYARPMVVLFRIMDLDLTKRIAFKLCQSNTSWGEPTFIAAGNSAAVFDFEHPTYGPVALKIYDPAFFVGENALIEEKRIRLQEKLRSHGNPHLIEVLGVGQIAEAGTWFLLMELCPWKTLEDRLNGVPDGAVESLLHQLVDAVQFLERKGCRSSPRRFAAPSRDRPRRSHRPARVHP